MKKSTKYILISAGVAAVGFIIYSLVKKPEDADTPISQEKAQRFTPSAPACSTGVSDGYADRRKAIIKKNRSEQAPDTANAESGMCNPDESANIENQSTAPTQETPAINDEAAPKSEKVIIRKNRSEQTPDTATAESEMGNPDESANIGNQSTAPTQETPVINDDAAPKFEKDIEGSNNPK